MKNILSMAIASLMILSLASCTNNASDSFQSKVDLLVNDRLATMKDSLMVNCNDNMDNAIAARVTAAKNKKSAGVSKPKSIVAPAASTTPVYVPPTTTTYTPPSGTTTTETRTTVQSKRDKIKGEVRTGTVRTTQDGKTVQDAATTDSKRDKIRGKRPN